MKQGARTRDARSRLQVNLVAQALQSACRQTQLVAARADSFATRAAAGTFEELVRVLGVGAYRGYLVPELCLDSQALHRCVDSDRVIVSGANGWQVAGDSPEDNDSEEEALPVNDNRSQVAVCVAFSLCCRSGKTATMPREFRTIV